MPEQRAAQPLAAADAAITAMNQPICVGRVVGEPASRPVPAAPLSSTVGRDQKRGLQI